MKLRSAVYSLILGLVALGLVPSALGQSASGFGRPVDVTNYGQWTARSQSTVTATSSQVITMSPCYFPVNGSSSTFYPLSPYMAVTITDPASTSETVIPTAVSTPVQANGVSAQGGFSCTFTATLSYAHSGDYQLSSGDAGLGEALQALGQNGGIALLPRGFSPNTAITTIPVQYGGVTVTDVSGAAEKYWTLQPNTLTALATPATRSASAGATQVISGTAVGTWTAVSTFVCVTYVDILGGESPCSASFSFTATVSVALNFASPAASTGAVGWRAYAGVTGTSTQYQMPISATTCTLSKLTPFPTCAIGSAGVFPTPSTTTALAPAAGGVAATYRPNTQSHTTFALQPQSRPPTTCTTGLQSNWGPFLIAPALTAGQAVVMATVPLNTGCLNYIGKTIKIRGRLTVTPSTGGTDQILVGIGDITDFTTGTPKAVCTLTQTTAITTAAQTQAFECTLTVNAIGTTGSIMPSGFSILQVGAGTTAGAAAVESATAAITVDTTNPFTLNIEFLQTSAAESTTPPQLQDLHIEEL